MNGGWVSPFLVSVPQCHVTGQLELVVSCPPLRIGTPFTSLYTIVNCILFFMSLTNWKKKNNKKVIRSWRSGRERHKSDICYNISYFAFAYFSFHNGSFDRFNKQRNALDVMERDEATDGTKKKKLPAALSCLSISFLTSSSSSSFSEAIWTYCTMAGGEDREFVDPKEQLLRGLKLKALLLCTRLTELAGKITIITLIMLASIVITFFVLILPNNGTLMTGWNFKATGQRQIEDASGVCVCVWIDVEEKWNDVTVPGLVNRWNRCIISCCISTEWPQQQEPVIMTRMWPRWWCVRRRLFLVWPLRAVQTRDTHYHASSALM